MQESITNSYGETFKVGDKVKFVCFCEKNPLRLNWSPAPDMIDCFNHVILEHEFTIDYIDYDAGTVSLTEEELWYWPIDSFTKVNSIKAKPHVHAELIKMWADDPTINIQYYSDEKKQWRSLVGETPLWSVDTKYRVKPKVKIEKRYQYAFKNALGIIVTTHIPVSEEKWKLHAKNNNIKEFVRLDFSMKEFEVEE